MASGRMSIVGAPGILAKVPWAEMIDHAQRLVRRGVCPTQGSANVALTIVALASRLAGRLAAGAAVPTSTGSPGANRG